MAQDALLRFSARILRAPGEEYGDPADQGLACACRLCEGDGGPDSPYRCAVSVENNGPDTWEGVLHVSVRRPQEVPQVFMPGFMYGTNRGDTPLEGKRPCPRLRPVLDKYGSPWWMVRGDRLTHPAVLILDRGRIFGLRAAPYWTAEGGRKTAVTGRDREFYQYAGFTCAAWAEDPELGLCCEAGYTLGYENAPRLFVAAHDVRERAPLDGQCFSLSPGERAEFDVYLYDYPAESALDLHRALRNVYWSCHEPPAEKAGIRQSVKLLAEAVADWAWLPERRAYSLFVFDRPGSGRMEYRELGSFSWTNGLSVAVPMLMSAVRLGDGRMREQAEGCIENIVENSLNAASGLPYDGYTDGKWTVRGWWYDCMGTPGHSGYIAGQGAYYLIRAYRFLKEHTGEERADWLAFAGRIVEKLHGQCNADGEYPCVLSEETGAGLEYDSTGSAWCLAAALAYMEAAGDRSMLPDTVRSEEHYHRAYVAKCQCYGGPLDITKGIDSEGILACIRAAASLHRLTGEDRYLQHLRDALDYEFTFKFCWNSPVQVPPLSTAGWCSCGGSVTSVVNPHIHPMSSSVTDDMVYYVRQTGDPYVKERLRDTVLWGCQTYARFDREYGCGKTGWMSERFCYSQGLLTERWPDGSPASTWFALMPWASASVLDGLAGAVWDGLPPPER